MINAQRSVSTCCMLVLAVLTIDQRGRVSAECGWGTLAAPQVAPLHAVMVYDSVRGVTVGFTGNSTWEWDGNAWTFRTSSGPQTWGMPAMAFDAHRGVTVLWGRPADGTLTTQLWEWNGTSWTQRFPSGTLPPLFNSAGMTYDPTRQVVVLAVPPGPWEWNGVSWTNRYQGGPQLFGDATRAAFDIPRGRLVVIASWCDEQRPECHVYNDVWEWSGTSWSVFPDGGFGVSGPVAFSPDRQKVVAWKAEEDYASTLWEWGSGSWSLITSGAPLAASSGMTVGLAYDTTRGRMVLYRGNNGDSHDDTAEWDGTTFTLYPADFDLVSRASHQMVFDADRAVTVLFGGTRTGGSPPSFEYLTDTMELSGDTWISRTITGPSGRMDHSMAHDSARGVTVLFGGTQGDDLVVNLGDTWEYDGSIWTQVSSTGPSPRRAAALAYDSVRGVTVLFGGSEGNGAPGTTFLGDTWEWNGSVWSLRTTSGPSPRNSRIAFDAARGVVVLYGGWTNSAQPQEDGETWEWDGSAWTLHPASGPIPSHVHNLSFDAARGVVVMFDNSTYGEGIGKVWNWDGDKWSLEGVSAPTFLGAVAYDTDRSRFVLQNGSLFVPTRTYGGSCPVSNPDGLKSRFLSVVVPNAGQGGPTGASAIRVAMVSLQHPAPPNASSHPAPDFSSYEAGPTCTDPIGCERWVGAPRAYAEASGASGVFYAASLQCSPYYHDWGALGLVHVTGSEIVPSSEYDFEVLSSTCMGSEDTCADVLPAVRLATLRHGDVAAPFGSPSGAPQPDALDVVAMVNRFRNIANAPTKPSAKLQPNSIDLLTDVNALDITTTVDAFRGFAYPYSGPCACPSTVTCNATQCSSPAQCSGGACVQTCIAGPNAGLTCLNASHCPASSCGGGYCRDRCGRCSP